MRLYFSSPNVSTKIDVMIFLSTSSLKPQQKVILNRIIQGNKNLKIKDSLSSGSSSPSKKNCYLVMNSLSATPKLVLALINQIPVVNFEFMLEYEKTGVLPKKLNDYAPLDGVLPMNHHPVLERKTISHGFVLITLDETEASVIKEIVDESGGSVVLFSGSTLDDWKDFMNDQLCKLTIGENYIAVRKHQKTPLAADRLAFLDEKKVPLIDDSTICTMIVTLKKNHVFKRTFIPELDLESLSSKSIPLKRRLSNIISSEVIPPTPPAKQAKYTIQESQGVQISTKSSYSHYESVVISDAEEEREEKPSTTHESQIAPIKNSTQSLTDSYQTFQTQAPPLSTLDSFMDDILGLGDNENPRKETESHAAPYTFIAEDRPGSPSVTNRHKSIPNQIQDAPGPSSSVRKSWRVDEFFSVPSIQQSPPRTEQESFDAGDLLDSVLFTNREPKELHASKTRVTGNQKSIISKRRDWKLQDTYQSESSDDEKVVLEEKKRNIKGKGKENDLENIDLNLKKTDDESTERDKKTIPRIEIDPKSISITIQYASLVTEKKKGQTDPSLMREGNEETVNYKLFRKSRFGDSRMVQHRVPNKLISVVPATAF